MQPISVVLLDIVIHFLVIEKWSLADLGQVLEDNTLVCIEYYLVVCSTTTIHSIEELSELLLSNDSALNLWASKMQLVLEVWQCNIDKLLQGNWVLARGEIRCTDGEHTGDELWVAKCNAVDDGSSPVMASQHDLRSIELGSESSNVVGCALVGIVFDFFWSIGTAVAHHVWYDNAEAEGDEERNLIAPSKTEIGPAVDQEDGRLGSSLWLTKHIMVILAIEVCGVMGDSRVGWCKLVDSHGEVQEV